MMQVTNRFDNINYFQNGSKRAENMVPQLQVKREKIGFWKGVGAMTIGYIASTGTALAYNQIFSRNIIKQVNKASNINISEQINQAFENSGLKSKSAELIDISKIVDVNDYNSSLLFPEENIIEYIRKEAQQNPIGKILNKTKAGKEFLENTEISPMAKMLAKGKNAAALIYTNKIILDSEKIGMASFHEMGHLMNRNFSRIGKLLQTTRIPLLLTTSILPTFALLTNKRSADNPPVTAWQKTKTFIKENIGKLTTLAFVPIIAEEIMASVKGQKLAKSVLPKELMKNVSRTHMLSTTSYIATALITGVGAFVANKVRDLIAHGKKST